MPPLVRSWPSQCPGAPSPFQYRRIVVRTNLGHSWGAADSTAREREARITASSFCTSALGIFHLGGSPDAKCPHDPHHDRILVTAIRGSPIFEEAP